jgi:hypothetical protein
MGRRPGPGYSIERADNNSGYSKANCGGRHALEKAANKRNTVLVCWDDHVMPFSRAAQHFGISFR